ncbi:MAG: YkgJ family cysteine cluster protein [Fibrobacteria bacterium]
MKHAEEPHQLPTDGFSAWLARTRDGQKTKAGADVPCGDCRGCCTSAYFIHIGPDETAALARIPKALRFKAPGLTKGHVLLGYDDKGHCPLFKDNACSIYADRPQTCRDYDCRVFPATGFTVEADKPLIAGQAVRWKFGFTQSADKRDFAAVQAAGAFLRDHARDFPEGFLPAHPTQLAVLALKVYGVFLEPAVNEKGTACVEIRGETAAEKAKAVVAAFEAFRSGVE